MKIKIKNFVAIFALALSLCTAFATSVPTASQSTTPETFTLNQLSKVGTIVLGGNRPSYTFYIPIPEQWQVDSIDLNLLIQFSSLLLESSSLTLMVGDTPLQSIKLNKKEQQPVLWKITIPKDLITKKMTTVRLIGYMAISDKVCQDLENQANWVTLSGDSSITYQYATKETPWRLMDFPYPFLHKNAPFPDKISFYLPSEMGVADFAPYFKLANLLAKKASWRGVTLDLKNFHPLPESGPEFPSVIIGTPDMIDFSSLGSPESLQWSQGKWSKKDGAPLGDGEGFLWLRRLGQQPVLIISANDKKGLATAVDSINSNLMHFLSTNASFFLAQPVPKTKKERPEQTTISFHDMGYKDNVVFGSGQSQLNYPFNLPASFANKPIKLVLNYSHSPFLQKDRTSTMSISINNFPIDGTALQADSAETNMLEIELPQKQLRVGKNLLTVTFNLMLPQSFCSREYLSQAWGTVYDNSYLQFYKSDEVSRDQINTYPSVMDGEVVVALPNDPELFHDKPLLQDLLRFAMTLDKSSSLQVIETNAVTPNLQQNLIYFGTGTEQSLPIQALKSTFTQLINNLNTTSNSVLRAIEKSFFINAFKQRQDIGFINMQPTGSKRNTSQLILYGFSTSELHLALSLLNNAYKLESLSGNLAVAFQNGTFTNLSSNEINVTVKKEVAMDHISHLTMNYLFYVLGVFLLILIYLGIRHWWKNRQ